MGQDCCILLGVSSYCRHQHNHHVHYFKVIRCMHSNLIIPSLGVYVDNRKLLFSSLRVYIVFTNLVGTRELESRSGEGYSCVSRWLHSQEPIQIIYNILEDAV